MFSGYPDSWFKRHLSGNQRYVDDAKATDNFKIFGVLYNLAAAEESCPEGWRLTESSDWEELSQYISIMNNGYEKVGYTWRNVGKRLKSTGTIIDGNGLWGKDAAEYEGTDDYGFSGLPGGYRHLDNIFKEIGLHGYWWLKSWSSSGSWWGAKLSYFNSVVSKYLCRPSCGNGLILYDDEL